MTWDIVSSGSGSAAGGGRGPARKLDYNIIDVSTFYPELMTIIASAATSIRRFCYNTATYGVDGPASWADFWDVKKFPGKRGCRGTRRSAPSNRRSWPSGVAPAMSIKFWRKPASSGRSTDPRTAPAYRCSGHRAQLQLMKDGEVDMTTGWNGRFDVAKKDGAQVAYTFNQALLDFDCFAIPKGAPNKDLAMKFLAEIQSGIRRPTCPCTSPMARPIKKPMRLAKLMTLGRAMPSHPDRKLQVKAKMVRACRETRLDPVPRNDDRVRPFRRGRRNRSPSFIFCVFPRDRTQLRGHVVARVFACSIGLPITISGVTKTYGGLRPRQF